LSSLAFVTFTRDSSLLAVGGSPGYGIGSGATRSCS
jgi:hypothetical protein